MGLAKLLIDLGAVGGWARMLFAIASRPARRWRWGWTAKLTTLFIAATMIDIWSGWFIPWGTLLVWWWILSRAGDEYELPMADGRPAR